MAKERKAGKSILKQSTNRKDKAMKTPVKTDAKDEVKRDEPRYDPIQERAPDRDVTKADQKQEAKDDKKLSPRQQIEKQMEANNLWISQHRDDGPGVHEREMANAELTHKLLDLDVLAREADRTAESLKA